MNLQKSGNNFLYYIFHVKLTAHPTLLTKKERHSPRYECLSLIINIVIYYLFKFRKLT